MVQKLTDPELDSFIAEFADILVFGYQHGVSSMSISHVEIHYPEFELPLRRVLSNFVDGTSDRFETFNERTQRFARPDPAEAWRNVGNEVVEIARTQQVHDDILSPQARARIAGNPAVARTEDQKREIHDQTVAAESEFRDRLWQLLNPYISVLDTKMNSLQLQLEQAEAAVRQLRRNRPAPAPAAQPYGVSPRGAEHLVADWMRHIGILDANVTPEKADGGIDVVSETHLAQVKHYAGKVSVIEVRELYGVAAARGKQALFFTSTGYTAEATQFAALTEVPLFVYDAEQGLLKGSNALATAMV